MSLKLCIAMVLYCNVIGALLVGWFMAIMKAISIFVGFTRLTEAQTTARHIVDRGLELAEAHANN